MYLPTKREMLAELELAQQNITQALEECRKARAADFLQDGKEVEQKDLAAFYDRLFVFNREVEAMEAKYS